MRLQARMQKRFEGIVAFLGREDIPFTNNATERDAESGLLASENHRWARPAFGMPLLA